MRNNTGIILSIIPIVAGTIVCHLFLLFINEQIPLANANKPKIDVINISFKVKSSFSPSNDIKVNIRLLNANTPIIALIQAHISLDSGELTIIDSIASCSTGNAPYIKFGIRNRKNSFFIVKLFTQ